MFMLGRVPQQELALDKHLCGQRVRLASCHAEMLGQSNSIILCCSVTGQAQVRPQLLLIWQVTQQALELAHTWMHHPSHQHLITQQSLGRTHIHHRSSICPALGTEVTESKFIDLLWETRDMLVSIQSIVETILSL